MFNGKNHYFYGHFLKPDGTITIFLRVKTRHFSGQHWGASDSTWQRISLDTLGSLRDRSRRSRDLARRFGTKTIRNGWSTGNIWKHHQRHLIYGKIRKFWKTSFEMMNTWWFDGNLILILLGYGCLMILMAVHPRNRVCGLVHSRSCRVSRCK